MEKTKIIEFTPANIYYLPLHITFTEHLPVETNVIKFVGIQLSWKPHIHYLLHKMSIVFFTMRRLSHILNIHTFRTVHFAQFHSLVNHGIIFWGNRSSVCKVLLIQKTILNISF